MTIAEVELRNGSGKAYTFSIPPYLKVNKDDVVVVLCDPRGTGRDDLTVGRVADVLENGPFAVHDGLKPVVDVVDTARYENFSNRIKKADSIRKAMDERLEDANKMLLYSQLAESDPKMKQLLDELEELEKED